MNIIARGLFYCIFLCTAGFSKEVFASECDSISTNDYVSVLNLTGVNARAFWVKSGNDNDVDFSVQDSNVMAPTASWTASGSHGKEGSYNAGGGCTGGDTVLFNFWFFVTPASTESTSNFFQRYSVLNFVHVSGENGWDDFDGQVTNSIDSGTGWLLGGAGTSASSDLAQSADLKTAMTGLGLGPGVPNLYTVNAALHLKQAASATVASGNPMLWPPAVSGSNLSLELGTFYFAYLYNIDAGLVEGGNEYGISDFNYALLCGNVSGVNNTCPWLGSAKPALPSASS